MELLVADTRLLRQQGKRFEHDSPSFRSLPAPYPTRLRACKVVAHPAIASQRALVAFIPLTKPAANTALADISGFQPSNPSFLAACSNLLSAQAKGRGRSWACSAVYR